MHNVHGTSNLLLTCNLLHVLFNAMMYYSDLKVHSNKTKKNNVKSLSFKDYNKNVRILFIIQDLGDFKQLVWFKQKCLGVSWHTSVSAYRLPVSVITNLNFKYFMCRGFNYVKNFTLVVRETIEMIQILIFVNLKTYQF